MDSKEKILNAALRLFITDGFDGTSTAKIVKESGVSNGTLFHYFKTKEDLISKLYLALKDDYKAYLIEHMGHCKTSKSKIKQLWYSCVQWYLNHHDGVIFFTMFSNSPYIDNLSREEASRNFDFIYTLFQEAINDESILDINQDLLLHYFYSSIRAFTNFATDHPDLLDKYQEKAFQMWWRSAANI